MNNEHAEIARAQSKDRPLADPHKTPTKASWESFLAERKALYSAQLQALRSK